jgi:hypothetical protein
MSELAQPLERVELGAVGLEFVADRLTVWSEKPALLLHAELTKRDLAVGHVWTWAPYGRVIDAHDLMSGLPEGVTQADHYRVLIGFVSDYLRSSGGVALIEDPEMSPDHSWPPGDPVPDTRTRCGDALCWYATKPAEVDGIMLRGRSLFFCMVLLPPTSGWTNPAPARITSDAIKRFAHAAEHIVVDAFDFEGFIVWSAHQDPQA